MTNYLFDGPKFELDDEGDVVLANPHVVNRRTNQGSDVQPRDRLTNGEQVLLDHPVVASDVVSSAVVGELTTEQQPGTPVSERDRVLAAVRAKNVPRFRIGDLPSPGAGGAEHRAANARTPRVIPGS